MGIKEFSEYFLFILSLSTFSLLSAESNKETGYGLFLSPESCVILDQSTQCISVVSIQWQVKQVGNYCLYSNQQNIPLECWQEKNQATKEIKVVIDKDVYFELRHQELQNIISQASLKIYRKTSNLRRKRRNPWSFY